MVIVYVLFMLCVCLFLFVRLRACAWGALRPCVRVCLFVRWCFVWCLGAGGGVRAFCRFFVAFVVVVAIGRVTAVRSGCRCESL